MTRNDVSVQVGASIGQLNCYEVSESLDLNVPAVHLSHFARHAVSVDIEFIIRIDAVESVMARDGNLDVIVAVAIGRDQCVRPCQPRTS